MCEPARMRQAICDRLSGGERETFRGQRRAVFEDQNRIRIGRCPNELQALFRA